jgi:D-alanyl-D-alanine carboxypeptidase
MLQFTLRKALATSALIILLIPAPSASREFGTSFPVTERRDIDRLLHNNIRAQHIPGLSIEVAVGDKILYAGAFGVRSSGKLVDANTIFPIGSITKQFTAACVMMLAEQQKIGLDSPIGRYIHDAPHAHEVTVRELLDQTSGLPDYTTQPQLQVAIGKKGLTALRPRRLIDMIANKPLKFKPGARFNYSNTNYVLAGMIVNAVSGSGYPEFLARHIFQPNRLNSTQYLRISIPQGANVARGFKFENGRQTEIPPFTMSWAGAAGALASNARDLVKWDTVFFGGKIVSRGTIEEMTRPVKSHYSYGWVSDRVQGDSMIWHNGELPGAHAMNAFFPRLNLEIVVLSNSSDANVEDIAKSVYAIVRR